MNETWRWYVNGEEVDEKTARKQIAINWIAIDEGFQNPRYEFKPVHYLKGPPPNPKPCLDRPVADMEKVRLASNKLYLVEFVFAGEDEPVEQLVYATDMDSAVRQCVRRYEDTITIIGIEEYRE